MGICSGCTQLSLKATAEKVEDDSCFDDDSLKRKFLSFNELFPRGIMEMNNGVPGTVESSINVGIVKTSDKDCMFRAELRGSMDATIQQVKQKVITISKVFGASLTAPTITPLGHITPSRPFATRLRRFTRKCFTKT